MNLEEVSCPICGSGQSDWLFDSQSQRLRESAEHFGVRRCRVCGLVFTSPRPVAAELDSMYGGSYFCGTANDFAARINRAAVREQAGFVQKYVPRGSVLDVGCGTGGFLMQMPADRFDIHGLEPYHGQYASIPEAVLARIRFEPFEKSGFADASFDLITLWHVLEHMREPLACLKKAFGLAKPGGRLVLEVPNFASREARWLGSHWHHLDVPFHLWHFTPQTLSEIVGKAGFAVETVGAPTPLHPLLRLNFLFMGARSIGGWAGEKMPLLQRGIWLRRSTHFLSVLACLMERVGLYFSSPSVRLVARKE